MRTSQLERHQELERQLLFTLSHSISSLLTNTLFPTSHSTVPTRQRGRKWEPRGREKGTGEGQPRQESTGSIGGSTFPGSGAQRRADSVCLQAVAEKGYETGEHAPGLKLGGCGAYKAAHHIIKVKKPPEYVLEIMCQLRIFIRFRSLNRNIVSQQCHFQLGL